MGISLNSGGGSGSGAEWTPIVSNVARDGSTTLPGSVIVLKAGYVKAGPIAPFQVDFQYNFIGASGVTINWEISFPDALVIQDFYGNMAVRYHFTSGVGRVGAYGGGLLKLASQSTAAPFTHGLSNTGLDFQPAATSILIVTCRGMFYL